MRAWAYQPATDLHMPFWRRLRCERREVGLVGSAVQEISWSLFRAYFAAAHRLSISGREHLPATGPVVLVANHASHLDALALAAALPRTLRRTAFPIAAGDVFFETRVRTALAALAINALPMWRMKCSGHALESLRARLMDEKCVYILFPEGKRSRDGEMERFKAGVGMLVAGTSASVVPCWIEGAHAAMPPGRCVPRPVRVRVIIGAPERFEDAADDRAGWNAVAGRLEERVRLLGPR